MSTKTYAMSMNSDMPATNSATEPTPVHNFNYCYLAENLTIRSTSHFTTKIEQDNPNLNLPKWSRGTKG